MEKKEKRFTQREREERGGIEGGALAILALQASLSKNGVVVVVVVVRSQIIETS